MLLNVFYSVMLLTCASAKFIPRFHMDLDHEEHELLKSVYDTPNYDHQEESEEHEEEELDKWDLMKDTKWAIKAKLQELKAFKKALKVNMLTTKLQLKDLLKNHMGPIINHHHDNHDLPVSKPEQSHYQNVPYAPQYPQPVAYPAQYPQQGYPAQYPQYPQQPYKYNRLHDPYHGQ